LYGTIGANSISWDSAFGKLDVPTEAVAYVMKTDSGSGLFMEGGNRIVASKADQMFRFKPLDGSEGEYSFDKVDVVGFKKATRPLAPLDDKVIIFDSDLSHLVLTDVKGKARFEGFGGTIEVTLEDISRIDQTAEGEKQIVILTDDRRLTGRFLDDPLTGRVAAVGTPITFNLRNVLKANVEVVRLRGDRVAGLDLLGVLESADSDVRRIAKSLAFGDSGAARGRLSELLDAETFKRLPNVKKDQVTLLDGVAQIREGKYDAAEKTLRKAAKAPDANVAAYAEACVAILKKYEGKYQGKPLSDPAVFVTAGADMADGMIREVRDLLKDARMTIIERRGDYLNAMNNVKKYEERIPVASVLGGAVGDDELIRLWRFALNTSLNEMMRIDKEIEEKQNEGRGRASSALLMQREIDALQADRRKAEENLQKYYLKLYDYGFRIEDPDIQQMREREADAGRHGRKSDDEGP
jgi:uncharacterized protein YlxW (UPF0749 family)